MNLFYSEHVLLLCHHCPPLRMTPGHSLSHLWTSLTFSWLVGQGQSLSSYCAVPQYISVETLTTAADHRQSTLQIAWTPINPWSVVHRLMIPCCPRSHLWFLRINGELHNSNLSCVADSTPSFGNFLLQLSDLRICRAPTSNTQDAK